jgi:hypothetical protein
MGGKDGGRKEKIIPALPRRSFLPQGSPGTVKASQPAIAMKRSWKRGYFPKSKGYPAEGNVTPHHRPPPNLRTHFSHPLYIYLGQ